MNENENSKELGRVYNWASLCLTKLCRPNIVNTPLKLEGVDTLSLHKNWWWRGPDKFLVNISASWLELETNWREINPELKLSRTKWQSTSMCLVRSWKTVFLAVCKAAWLSQNRGTGAEICKWKSPSSRTNQEISATTILKALYSASADERDNRLFLALPWNRTASKSNIETSDKPFRNRTCSPIRVWESC